MLAATPASNTETASAAGLARLLSVKSLDYQEHASEYGVHWNFFLTVAAVSTLTTIAPIPKPYSLAAGRRSHRSKYSVLLHTLVPNQPSSFSILHATCAVTRCNDACRTCQLSAQLDQWHEQLCNPMYHVCHIHLKSQSLHGNTLLEPVWLEESATYMDIADCVHLDPPVVLVLKVIAIMDADVCRVSRKCNSPACLILGSDRRCPR